MNDFGQRPWPFMDIGRLDILLGRRADLLTGPYDVIAGAAWSGPPMTILSFDIVEKVPSWAKTDDGFIQIGEYVLRNTGIYSDIDRSYYWIKVSEGEFYLLRWKLCEFLSRIMRKVGITIAVWKGEL